MKLQFLLIPILIKVNTIYAQEMPYKFSKDIIATKVEKQDNFTLQMAATDFAFQGDYMSALRTWNEQLPNQKSVLLSSYDSLFFKNSKVFPAKEYIIDRSKTEEIIILNELHHNASHRVFGTSLLKELYKNGYRYLGLEALTDSLINVRKYPILESGFYTSEPQFGNFIKEALEVGFTVFGYETTEDANWDSDGWKNREIAQARNIYHFMQNNKEGKYFIYCGAGHVFEGDNKGRGLSMAGVLADLTKINPFTIDQNRYSFKADDRYNNPLVKMVKNDAPSILIHSNKEVFRGNPISYETDISIIQPENAFHNKNFFWFDGYGEEFYIPKEHITAYPALVLVYQKNGFEKNAVPEGVVELTSEKDNKKIYVKKGNHKVVVLNTAHEVIYTSE